MGKKDFSVKRSVKGPKLGGKVIPNPNRPETWEGPLITPENNPEAVKALLASTIMPKFVETYPPNPNQTVTPQSTPIQQNTVADTCTPWEELEYSRKQTENERKLYAMEPKRALTWRNGEKNANSDRSSYNEGKLLFTRGTMNVNKCKSCRSGHGAFPECISLEEIANGACASCHFTSSGNRCTSRWDTKDKKKKSGGKKRRREESSESSESDSSSSDSDVSTREQIKRLEKQIKKLKKSGKSRKHR